MKLNDIVEQHIKRHFKARFQIPANEITVSMDCDPHRLNIQAMIIDHPKVPSMQNFRREINAKNVINAHSHNVVVCTVNNLDIMDTPPWLLGQNIAIQMANTMEQKFTTQTGDKYEIE